MYDHMNNSVYSFLLVLQANPPRLPDMAVNNTSGSIPS